MSGITLRQILMCINRYEQVMIESEFGTPITNERGSTSRSVESWLAILSSNDLELEFDYIRNVDGIITIGMNSNVFKLMDIQNA